MIVVEKFKPFELVFNQQTGETTTVYKDGNRSGCLPNPDDQFHGKILQITDKAHRLVHEILHHLLGFNYYLSTNGSLVVYRDAHGVAQDWVSQEEEWLVTALTYDYYNQPWPHKQSALSRLSRMQVDIDVIKAELCDLLNAFYKGYNS